MGLENQNVEEKLKNAAFAEWKMTAEQNIPISTISQVRQIRLFCLITNVFENFIPSENQIGLLFHIAPSTTKNLLNNVLASFSEQLEKSLKDSCRKLVLSATLDKSKDFYILPAEKKYLISKINEYIKNSKKARELQQLKYLPANNNFYEVPCEVYDFYKGEE